VQRSAVVLLSWQKKNHHCLTFWFRLVWFGTSGPHANYGFPHIGYGADGERLVAGVVPTNKEKTYVLLIQSTRRNGWVLPKGGWETDEECNEAAEREAWEEAGIVCKMDWDLGKITETRTAKQISKDAPKALYNFYEATVVKEEDEWPEKHKRSRKWFTYAEAAEHLKARPELAEALKRSSVKR
jgi:diphosphoinositol-polyphosphate diphosphatase